MPTNKPRISLVLEPERYALYAEVAKLQGVKVQTVVAEMLDMAHPAIEQAVVLLRRLHALPAEHRADILLAAELAEGAVNEAVAEFVQQFDMAEELLAPEEGPQHSNTGSSFDSQVQNLLSNPSSFSPSPSSPPSSSPVPDESRKGAA